MKKIGRILREYWYLNPDCPHCRMVDNYKIIVVLMVFVMGIYYLYTIQDDLESQCCEKVKEYNIFIAEQNSGASQVIWGDEYDKKNIAAVVGGNDSVWVLEEH